MPKVTIPPPHNMVLSDRHSSGRWYFQLEGRPAVTWLTGDQFSIVLNSEGRRIGDFDEQRDWSGGRGGERFSEDPTKYKDAKDAATFIPGHLFPTLQWQIAEGYRDAEQHTFGSKSWRGLHGDTRYISTVFTASASSNREAIWLWVRRVGTPGTLTVELRSDSTGDPGTVLKTATIDTDDITDVISVFQKFTFTAQAVTLGTDYHIVAYGASTDTTLNHWEVAVDVSGTDSKYSSGSGWTAADFSMYYRVTDGDASVRWWFFEYDGYFFKVGTFVGGSVELYRWNEAADAWEEITGHGLSAVNGRPVVANGFCYFPRGSFPIRVYNGSSWDDQTVANGQGAAHGLAIGYSESDGKTQIWRYNNTAVSGATTTGLKSSVSRADVVTTYTTDLKFRNSIFIGENTNSSSITGIDVVNNTLWVRKTNEIGTVTNDRYTELNYGVKKTPSATNGQAFLSWNGYIFYNWLFSTQRVFSGTVDDVGQGFKSKTFPAGREGIDAAYTSYVAWMFVAKDAYDGTSAIMLYDGLNWHEFVRGWAAGRRIRDVAIQTVTDDNARLWFDCGGDSAYIELPYKRGNPLDDDTVVWGSNGVSYMHEFVLESSEIDMGTASKLPKFIKDLTMTSKNLGNGIRVELDYQVDDEIGTSTWRSAGDAFTQSPEDSIDINEGNIRKFAYRLRGQTDNHRVPPDIRGIVPNGFARSPMRRILECNVKVKDTTVNGKMVKARDILNWLEEAASGSYLIHVDSVFEPYNDFDCILAPPNIYPIKTSPETDMVTFTLLVL